MSSYAVCISALLLVSASSLTGCLAEAETFDESDGVAFADDGDLGELGETEQAFGEAACATAPSIENSTDWNIASYTPYYSATTGNYGSPGCPHSFIVDFKNGTNHDVNIWVGNYTQATTSGACSLARVKAHTYHWINGQWVFQSEMKRHGAWRGGECWFDLDDGSTQATVGTVPTRVVAQAYSTFCLFGSCSTTYQSVKVQAYETM